MAPSVRKLLIAIAVPLVVTVAICGAIVTSVIQLGPIFAGNLLLASVFSMAVNAAVFLYLSWSWWSFLSSVLVSSCTGLLIYAAPRIAHGGVDAVLEDGLNGLAIIAALIISLVICGLVAVVFALVRRSRRRSIASLN